jgi:hypothetical protein
MPCSSARDGSCSSARDVDAVCWRVRCVTFVGLVCVFVSVFTWFFIINRTILSLLINR